MTPARSDAHRALLIATIVGLSIYAAGVGLAQFATAGLAARLAGLLVLLWVTAKRRTLTAWTFFAILAGAELGADAPVVAVHLHVFAEIFLRLVRVIVAPLILGTLTTGIAAHGQVKSLGRVALKTLVYFEAVTTLALLLGVAAIDLSRAGEGVVVPATLLARQATAAGSAHEGLEGFLLNIFPENLVTAIGENQIDRKAHV